MNKVKLILICFSLILVGCSEDDPVSPVEETVFGTYVLSAIIMHGADCSVDDGSSGVCFPPEDGTFITFESDCVETGTGDCWDENSNGIEGIVEIDCASPNRWVNFGWNLWTAFFPELSYTFSDDGTYTGGEDESGTWTLDGATLTATDSSSDEVIIATVSGNTFTAQVLDTFTSDSVDCAEMTFAK